jgi:plasmid stabilization system protein ParE
VSYRIRFHPAVSEDLDSITAWLMDYTGSTVAERRLGEIEATIEALADPPYKGSRRDEIAPGLRAVPADRKAVVAFTVDDDSSEVHVHAVAYAGADWVARSKERRR